MFFAKLRGIYPSLTYSETKIAEYILANRDSIANQTSHGLAEAINVSQPTIIRFSKKIGYRSYRSMLTDLEHSDVSEDVVEEIQLKDSILTTNQKIKNHIQQLMELTCEINDESVYQQAITLIQRSKAIFCYGFLSTGSMADHMRCLLQLFGFNAYCLDNYSTMENMRHYSGGALLIAFSKSGETNVTNGVVRFAKDRGIKIVGVTNMAPNTMAPYLDVWLKTIFSPVKTRFLHYTEMSSILFVINAIILNLYKRNFAEYADKVAEHVLFTKLSPVDLPGDFARKI